MKEDMTPVEVEESRKLREDICEWCCDNRASTTIRGEHICGTCKREWNKQPDDGRF